TAQTEAYQARVQTAINAGQTRAQAEAALSTEWFGEPIQGTGRQFRARLGARLEAEFAASGPGVVDAAYNANAAALQGHVGATPTTGATDAQIIENLRTTPEMRFSNESAAAYHVEKHVRELPPSEAPTSTSPSARVTAYLASATETVH